MEYKKLQIAHNGRVYATGAKAPAGFRSPNSVVALPLRLDTPRFASAKNATHFFIRSVKRRIRSERYAKCNPRFLNNYVKRLRR
jgi:hypothetical protein